MTQADHVTIRNVSEGCLFYCAHCRLGTFLALPASFDVWRAEGKRFMDAHRHCPPPAVMDNETVEDGSQEAQVPAMRI